MDNCESKAVVTNVIPINTTYPMTYVLLVLDGGSNVPIAFYILLNI